MDEVIRYDRSSIGKTFKTSNGFLRTDAVITRTGIFKYKNPDGTIRRELRRPEEVFKQDALDSIKMIPVTNNHPYLVSGDENDKMVTTVNAGKYQVGFTGETVRKDGENVRTTLTITDPVAIEAIEHQGRNKLSLGYKTKLIMVPGIYNGDAYDCEQTEIRSNHLAIVDIPRAGDVAKIELDSADIDIIDPVKPVPLEKEATMPKVNLDGIEYEALPEVANALTKALKSAADLQTKLDGMAKGIDKINADADTLKAENVTLKARDISKEISDGVIARLALERMAAVCLDSEDSLSSSSDAEIKTMVIEKVFPEIKLDGKSSDYVNACFDNAVALIVKNDDGAAMREQRKQSGSEGINNDGKADDPRSAYVDRLVHAYQVKK
jgi:hypothetical protein